MIRKKYAAILLVIVALVVGGILCSPYLDWYMIPQSTSLRSLYLVREDNTETELANQFLWFTFDGDDMVLHYLPAAANFTTIRWLTVDGDYGECPIEEFQTDDTMAGTFLVTTDEPVSVDLDQDGTPELVRFTAKVDTNACKTFYGYEHTFAREDIPLELVINYTASADVLAWGQPWSGDIHIQSLYSFNDDMTLEEGVIDSVSYKECEAGSMVVTCQSGEETLVCSYIQETNVLNRQHLRALAALGVLLIATVVLIVVFHWVRKWSIQKKYRN